MKTVFALSLALSLMLATSAAFAATVTVTLTAGTNATSHRIEKKTGAGSYATVTTLAMPTLTYVDSSVAVGTTVCYRAYGISAMPPESAASAECCSAIFTAGPPTTSCTVNP